MKTRTNSGLPARVLRFARQYDLLPRGGVILCALSGGRDSMALLEVLRDLSGPLELTVLAAHYNHQLRGAESRRDEDFAAAWCRDRGVPLSVGRGDVAARAGARRQGLEETAREMRYAFLEETARRTGADRIATAHNAEDNLETVLLHLVRGAGLDGLTGIPPRRGNLIRPLLDTPRREIDAYLAARGVPYVEDSSNALPDYTRNRLRQQVLPVLLQCNPGLPATLAENLVHLREDRDLLRSLAEDALREAAEAGDALTVPVSALTDRPRPVSVRAVRLLLERLGRFQVSRAHLEAVLALAGSGSPSGSLDLPGGLTVRRRYRTLEFSLSPAPAPVFPAQTIPGPGRYFSGSGWTVTLTEGVSDGARGPWRCCLRRDAAPFPLTLRPRLAGDLLRLPGRPEKTLKKWYIEEKIPRLERDALPVLAGRSGPLMAAGLGPQAALIAEPGQDALLVTITPTSDNTGKDRNSL